MQVTRDDTWTVTIERPANGEVLPSSVTFAGWGIEQAVAFATSLREAQVRLLAAYGLAADGAGAIAIVNARRVAP